MLKLSFVIQETMMGQRVIKKTLKEVLDYFKIQIKEELEAIPGAHWSENAALILKVKGILKYPVVTLRSSPNYLLETLVINAKQRLDLMYERIDKAIFLAIQDQTIEGYKELKRLERLRIELDFINTELNNGKFEVYECTPFKDPILAEEFPALRENRLYIPSSILPPKPVSIKTPQLQNEISPEPEYFINIFNTPETNIPDVLAALKYCGFIDDKEQWNILRFSNPLAPIMAFQHCKKRAFFKSVARVDIERAFCDRFGIQRPQKGFEVKPGNKKFQRAKEEMERYLERKL